MKKKRRRFYPEHYIQYLFSIAFFFVAQALPLRMALQLGEWGGRHIMLWTRRGRNVGIENLLRAYPEMNRSDAEKATRKVYEHFGRALVEVAVAHRLLRPSTIREHISLRHEERLLKVLKEGRGAIFVSAHLGIWEIFGLLLRYYGVSTTSVYRPIKNKVLDGIVRRRRAAFGQIMVPREGALAILLRVLRGKGYIALLTDQHAKRDGVWIPFFGRLASTTPAPALLALRTGAPIVTCYVRRMPGVYRFEVFIDEPIYVQPTGNRKADVERITREISCRIEEYIRETPEQWLWLHRRWREPPPEVENGEKVHVGKPVKID